MKILLINPPALDGYDYIREGRCMQKKSSWAAMWMPLTLAYIASVLRKDNEIKMIDCQAENIDFNKLQLIIQNFAPNLLVSNTSFPTIKSDLKVLEIAKTILPNIKTSIFGMYPTLMREKVFEESSSLDFSITGEPEWSYQLLSDALNGTKNLKDVSGLIYRSEQNTIEKNLGQNFSENTLDDLPFPARDLLHNDKYKYPLNKKPFTLLMLSRGCPYGCTFCNAHQYYGKKFRKRTVSSIIAEIEDCVNNYGISNFLFWGESFSLDFNYANEITDAILAKGLKINWSTRTMVDRIDTTLLKKMKQAGCRSLSLGIETFNQEILDSVKKGTQIADIQNAIKAVNAADIISIGHFIIGLPGDNEQNATDTINFSLKSGLDYAQFYCAVPYPHTPMGEFARMQNWIESEDYTKYHLADAVMRNENLSAADIKRLRKKAYTKFYSRPKVYFNTLKRVDSVKTLLAPFDFKNWAIG